MSEKNIIAQHSEHMTNSVVDKAHLKGKTQLKANCPSPVKTKIKEFKASNFSIIHTLKRPH